MSELNASNLRKEHGNEGPDLVGTTELTSPYFMVPPSGNTKERPQNPQPGTLRFNTDIGSLEYFKGDTIGWETIDRNPNVNLDGGARALYMGGATPAAVNTIDYFTISTLGDATDFGDLVEVKQNGGGVSSRVFGLLGGGWNGSPANMIQKITFASTGNSVDTGVDTSASKNATGGLSNGTRGLFCGGASPTVNAEVDGIDIASSGVKFDWGDLTTAKYYLQGCSSSTRGIIAAGVLASPFPNTNAIDYVTIATAGSAADFGDLPDARGRGASLSNSTRAVFGGSHPVTVSISYVTIATTGNTVDFGDLTVTRAPTGASSPTRGLFMGGVPGQNLSLIHISEPTRPERIADSGVWV